MKKFLFIGLIGCSILGASNSFAQDFSAMQQIQNGYDDQRDAAIARQQALEDRQMRAEQARRDSIARSVVAKNRQNAAARAAEAKYQSENREIDLAERRATLQHDQVKASHSEDFVQGELARQKAINNQISQGHVGISVGTVDAD